MMLNMFSYLAIIAGLLLFFLNAKSDARCCGDPPSSNSQFRSVRKQIPDNYEADIETDLDDEEDQDRIVGGNTIPIEEAPYQLSLRKGGYHTCGASIIAENWALTAAHCVNDVSVEELSLRAGSNYSNDGGEIHEVEEVVVHPENDDIYYDVALIKVKEPFPLGEPGIEFVKLTSEEPELETRLMATGWGATSESGDASQELQSVIVEVSSREECNGSYAYKITEIMFCAGVDAGGFDSCQGDSGGPIVNIDREQVGVISFGTGCARPHTPGVYVNLALVKDWINEVTGGLDA